MQNGVCSTATNIGLCSRHWPEAVEAAFAVKDVNALQEVKAKSGNPKVAAQVDSYLSQLTQRR